MQQPSNQSSCWGNEHQLVKPFDSRDYSFSSGGHALTFVLFVLSLPVLSGRFYSEQLARHTSKCISLTALSFIFVVGLA